MNTELLVTILLSAYNGASYLDEQLESIIKQSYKNWKLFIRDDGSADDTLKIIHKYLQQDSRINLITDDRGNLGAAQSFNVLLNQAAQNEYIMFCDQDDVWLNNKIDATMNTMLLAEKQYGIDSALLVYTNFSYVDEQLQEIKSKKNYNATKVKSLKLSHLILQNPAYGCTMMMNHQLLKLVNNIPSVAENHDYWVALVCSAFGNIIYLNKKTILYRQHSSNVSGSHNNDSIKKRFKRIFLQGKNFANVQYTVDLITAFRNYYTNQLSYQQKKIINDFIKLAETKKISLLKRNLNNGVKRQTFVQTLLFYFSLFLHKRKTV